MQQGRLAWHSPVCQCRCLVLITDVPSFSRTRRCPHLRRCSVINWNRVDSCSSSEPNDRLSYPVIKLNLVRLAQHRRTNRGAALTHLASPRGDRAGWLAGGRAGWCNCWLATHQLDRVIGDHKANVDGTYEIRDVLIKFLGSPKRF